MGKEPVWNDFNTVNHIINLDDIHSGDVVVEFVNDGDKICELKFTVPELIATKNASKWYDSKRNGKQSGSFKMQVVYDGPRPEEAKNDYSKKASQDTGTIASGTPVGGPGMPPMGMPAVGAPS